MKIGSISENKNIEKRVAITPEVAKKYISNGNYLWNTGIFLFYAETMLE